MRCFKACVNSILRHALTGLLLLVVRVQAETWHPSPEFLDAVRFVESSDGRFVYGDGGRSLGEYQMSRAAWSDVNRWRSARGERTYDYSGYVFNPEVSRWYAANYLSILREQLARRLKRSPTLGEIYAAYNMGLGSFAECRFNLKRVNALTLRKCREIERRVQQGS